VDADDVGPVGIMECIRNSHTVAVTTIVKLVLPGRFGDPAERENVRLDTFHVNVHTDWYVRC
jgi:hypothetical protein